ncbi:MAG: hypothetical protein AAFQ55_19410 [Pseudomonadota bacterium]
MRIAKVFVRQRGGRYDFRCFGIADDTEWSAELLGDMRNQRAVSELELGFSPAYPGAASARKYGECNFSHANVPFLTTIAIV